MQKSIFTLLMILSIVIFSCQNSNEDDNILSSVPSHHNGCGLGTGSDCTYPLYSTEFLQPFRANFFSSTTLPAAHLRFVDQATGLPIANQNFSVHRLSDNAQPGNTTITDNDGFWLDEDFQADPGSGTYEVTICDQHFFFVYDGTNPSINLFETTECVVNTPNFWDFENIPQNVLEQARSVYGDVAPAVTIAFTFNNGASLEDDWVFSIFSSPEQGCVPGEEGDFFINGPQQHQLYQSYDQGAYEAQDGFVFFEEDELCGLGDYLIDNRQGSYFDVFCGPDSRSFNYQGEEIFILVKMYCE